MPMRCPSGDVEQGAGHSFLGFGREVGAADTNLGVLGIEMLLKSTRLDKTGE